MASDRARISIDRSRDYRAVVHQQGRVVLEADSNEEIRLAEDALREDVIDIVGPAGTPDDGYKVEGNANGATIGAGTFYLGGWRLTLDQPMPVGQGPDSLDSPVVDLEQGHYEIALLVTEQEIAAVEDRALREVALGGPDTCQRTRLMQRGVAIEIKGDDCPTAEAELVKQLDKQGADFDPATGALLPTARLKVVPVSSPAPVDPCDPPASGGYLGADNQLIRVSVTVFDPNNGKGSLVWGFDDASTAYRASTADGKVLALESDPVDSDHAPRLGQAVEVLQTRKLFDHGEVVAADSGIVATLADPYDSDLRQVRLPLTLAAGERGDADHPLFLRLWEAEVDFEAGTPVELGDTGLAVSLTLDAAPGGDIVARPFWAFAARPFTPNIVYPRRYLDAPQPPEGPRQWLASLAVVAAEKGKGVEVLDDCRDTFLPLTKLKPGCCGVLLDASDKRHADQIQRMLDKLRGTRGSVMLRPGHYKLRKPIRLDSSHLGLTIEGCGEGVFLEAEDESDPAFREGLIVLDDVNEVTLRAIQFQLPAPDLTKEGAAGLGTAGGNFKGGVGSVGVSASGCAQLVVRDCQFRFRLRDRQPIMAIGLLQRGECWGLRLIDNRFLHDVDFAEEKDAVRMMYGYALSPSVDIGNERLTNKALSNGRLDSLLSDTEIVNNEFVGLTYAILVLARLGDVRVERNRVKGCSAGIYLLESAMGAALRILGRSLENDGTQPSPVPFADMALAMNFADAVHGKPVEQPVFTNNDLRRPALAAEDRARRFFKDNEGAGGGTQPASEGHLVGAFERLSAAIEARLDRLVPLLHVAGNDVGVFGTVAHSREKKGQDGGEDVPGLSALLIVLEQREADNGDVLVTANRLASRHNPAVLVAWPENLVVSSNIVIGSGGDVVGGALVVQTDPKRAMIEVTGNVVRRYARIQPPEVKEAPSKSWSFFNQTW